MTMPAPRVAEEQTPAAAPATPLDTSGDGHPRPLIPVSPQDHVRGPSDAPVTIVEYGDFECLDTARAAIALREVQHELGGLVRLVYRHFPLSHKHPHAQWAAEAAEAAGAQDRFWEMHDALFVHQQLLGEEHLDLYVPQLGLDADRLRRDLATHAYTARVRTDYDGGAQSGVHGTPTFFINGALYDGADDRASLATVLRAAAHR